MLFLLYDCLIIYTSYFLQVPSTLIKQHNGFRQNVNSLHNFSSFENLCRLFIFLLIPLNCWNKVDKKWRAAPWQIIVFSFYTTVVYYTLYNKLTRISMKIILTISNSVENSQRERRIQFYPLEAHVIILVNYHHMCL